MKAAKTEKKKKQYTEKSQKEDIDIVGEWLTKVFIYGKRSVFCCGQEMSSAAKVPHRGESFPSLWTNSALVG